MTKVLLFLFILFSAALVCAFVYEKVIHPILFKEELEETAAEEKVRKDIELKASEILGGDDANK